MYVNFTMHFCLDEDFKANNFPEKFGNHLYFSRETSLDYYSYNSVYSLKYVIEGKEEYEIDGSYKKINSGQFLLVNNNSPVLLLPSTSKAVSIFIDPNLFTDVLNNVLKSEESLLDDPLAEISDFNVFEKVYDQNSLIINPLLEKLRKSHELAFSNNLQLMDKNFFYSIARAIIYDQSQNNRQLSSIRSSKNCTRQEILNRLKLAKTYIQDNPEKSHSLNELAELAIMSPFHFHRNFKSAFGISPKQYSLALKLDLAKNELRKYHNTVIEIAHKYGFADSSAFIRAYKKQFGISPKKSISKI